ncbi:MAG: glycosyltransferase family 2 protein [Parvibaculaceae bacterium]|nr:glycosyltransferase family 2 protein [Parvibaculaceae bacterium]
MLENTCTNSSPKLSIIVPSFNEAESVASVIADMISTLDASELKGNFEIILVDDGSSDGSWTIIEELPKIHSVVRSLRNATNGGMWRAIQTGMHAAKGDFVTYLPADGEITATETIKLASLASDADIVVSKRVSSDAVIKQQVRPWYREVLSWGQRTLTRIVLGCDISNAEGIFLLRWSVFKEFALAPRHDNILFLELLVRGLTGGYRVAETEMFYTLRRGGRSKTVNLAYIIGTLADLIKLRLRMSKRLR